MCESGAYPLTGFPGSPTRVRNLVETSIGPVRPGLSPYFNPSIPFVYITGLTQREQFHLTDETSQPDRNV